MQLAEEDLAKSIVVISFQFSTFVSLMQLAGGALYKREVVISFQFSTFVSLMQLFISSTFLLDGCD